MLIKYALLTTTFLSIVCLIYLNPVYEPHDCPKAPYAVGIAFRHITYSTRTNNPAIAKAEPRQLMLQIWYPAITEITSAKPSFWGNTMSELKSDIQEKTYLPTIILNNLLTTKTCSILNSPISEQSNTYPVVIFSANNPSNYTRHIEHIANHGYIVVGIDHINKYTTRENILSNPEYSFNKLNLRVEDIQFVFNQLSEFNRIDTLLKNKLNVDKVAFMGHSFNGVVALSACRKDNRCKAVINLDGSLSFDKHADQPIEKPVLMLLQDYERESFLAKRLKGLTTTKEEYLKYKYSSLKQLCKSPKDPVYTILIKNAGHDSFSDLLFLKWPLATLANIDIGQEPYKIFSTINNYVIDFLNKYLKDLPAPLLDEMSTCKIEYVNIT